MRYRIELIKSRALQVVKYYEAHLKGLFDSLHDKSDTRYKAEVDRQATGLCNLMINSVYSVKSLLAEATKAIESEKPLLNELRLEQIALVVDHGTFTFQPPAPEEPPAPKELLEPNVFSIHQLDTIQSQLAKVNCRVLSLCLNAFRLPHKVPCRCHSYRACCTTY